MLLTSLPQSRFRYHESDAPPERRGRRSLARAAGGNRSGSWPCHPRESGGNPAVAGLLAGARPPVDGRRPGRRQDHRSRRPWPASFMPTFTGSNSISYYVSQRRRRCDHLQRPLSQEFEFKHGPVFTNFLLADEINRATPKTQSALLEAMNELQVTADGRSYPLEQPFMVIATQNPVEHHGAYPLPESQLDRFLMRIRIGYPDAVSGTARSCGRRLAPRRKRSFP